MAETTSTSGNSAARHQGWLTKESGNMALQRISMNKQKRFCVIHEDSVLRYYKRENAPLEEACGEIHINRLEYVRLITGAHNNCYFELKEWESDRIPYVFEASTVHEASHWVHMINSSRGSDPTDGGGSPSPHSSSKSSALSGSQKQQKRRDENIVLEGYLSKKSRGRSLISAAAGTNRWAERRFCIYFPEKVVVYFEHYTYRGEYVLDEHTTVVKLSAEDEDGGGRTHVFELRNSSTGDVLRCSADSEWRADKWVQVLSQIISGEFTFDPSAAAAAAASEAAVSTGGGGGSASRRRMSGMSIATKALLAEVASLSPQCADCATPAPTWASVNNGVLICTACSGVHRSLGVLVSFVQSLKLDVWTEENVQLLRTKGPNDVANVELEFHVPAEFAKPTAKASRETRAKYITAKYAAKAFGRFDPNDQGEPKSERPALPPVYTLEEVAPTEKSVGELEFIGILVIKLISCSDLEKSDFLGKSDPYVLLTAGQQTVKSKRVDKTLNPKFDETLMLSWDGSAPLVVQVMDHDKFKKDDPLGSLTIALGDDDELLSGGGCLRITDRPLEGVSRGKVSLEVTFNRL